MHDYRYNQFDDYSNTITKTERHLIPNASPYTIQLNEVPVKTSPSSLSVKIVDPESETYGTTFTEVAVTPSIDTYMPDYYSEADSDENWNTGTLLFNVGNAGQEVSITYTAQGTLNSVLSPQRPSFWTERGDGSDGILLADTDMTISGLKQYKSVYIASGVTVTVDGFADIRCQGAFVNYGTINASGGGGRGGYSLDGYADDGYGSSPLGSRGEKSICGGYGGSGYRSNGSSGVGINGITVSSLNNDLKKYALTNNIICSGGGGSHSGGVGGSDDDTYKYQGVSGGNGGGFIRVIAKSHYNSGTYISNGNNGSSASSTTAYRAYKGGGGGGGVIIVIAERNLSSGSFTHTGGTGYANGGDGWHEVLEIGGEY